MTKAAEPVVSEEQAWAKWQEIGGLIDVLAQRSDARDEWAAQPRSPLAGDDRLSAPYQVSHAVHQCMTAGIDHAHAAKSLIVDHHELHTAAPGSLSRGFIENMAAAFWMLHPKSRRDRVTHAMQWYAQNVKDQHAAFGGIDRLGPPRMSREDRLARLVSIAEAAGYRDASWLVRGYRPSEPVEYAEQQAGTAGKGMLLSWRLGSGFAHGRPWAFLGVLQQEAVPTPDPGVLHVRLTNDFTRSLFPMLAGMQLAEAVLTLHDERARPPY